MLVPSVVHRVGVYVAFALKSWEEYWRCLGTLYERAMPLYFQYEEEGSGREVAWLIVTLQRLRNDWPLPKHTAHIDWPLPNRTVSFY